MSKGVRYLKIAIEGFGSFGKPVSFSLDRVGVNIVSGKNGIGKTSVFNALIYCEYGKNLKKNTATWKDKRTKNFRGTRVVVDRQIGDKFYRVARHLAFKGTTCGLTGADNLMLFISDTPKFTGEDLVGSKLHKADIQELINEQLGMEYSNFMKSIFFGQNMQSLVKSPTKDQRVVFEKMFDVDFVARAKDKAKEKYTEVEKKKSGIEIKESTVETRLEDLEEKIQKAEETLRDFDAEKKDRIATLESEIGDINKRLKTIPTELKNLKASLAKSDDSAVEKLEKEIESQDAKKTSAQTKSRELKNAMEAIDAEIEKSTTSEASMLKELEDVEENCPYCDSKLDKKRVAAVKKEINARIAKEKKVRATLDKKLPKLKKDADKAQVVYDTIKVAYTEMKTKLKSLKETSKNTDAIKSDISSTLTEAKLKKEELDRLLVKLKTEKDKKRPKDDTKAYKKEQAELEKERTTYTTKIEKLEEELENIGWWIKKGFGAGGVKAFVFNAMLTMLNEKIATYAARLGFRVEFAVDMNKANKPFTTKVYEDDVVRDYEDLSGGQMQRIDVCIAFAMNDLANVGLDINLIVMDEVTTGLDQEGMEVFFELLRMKAESKSIFLVSHLTTLDTMNCRLINVTRDSDGHTKFG